MAERLSKWMHQRQYRPLMEDVETPPEKERGWKKATLLAAGGVMAAVGYCTYLVTRKKEKTQTIRVIRKDL